MKQKTYEVRKKPDAIGLVNIYFPNNFRNMLKFVYKALLTVIPFIEKVLHNSAMHNKCV